jgi:hypothetical protein
MATYYVRTDGNNGNSGTGQGTGQAWQTVTYALVNMVLTSGTNYLYIAPGVYRELPTVTVTPSITQPLEIVGDATASIFTGVSAGVVRITNYVNDNITPTNAIGFTCAKTYVSIRNIFFQLYGYANFTNSSFITIDKCIFDSPTGSPSSNIGTLRIVSNGSASVNATITKSVFTGSWSLVFIGPTAGSFFDFASTVTDCLFMGKQGMVVDGPSTTSGTVGNGVTIFNCSFIAQFGISFYTTNSTHPSVVKNCIFYWPGEGGYGISSTATNRQTEDFNRFAITNPRSNVTIGTNSLTGMSGLDLSASYIQVGTAINTFAPFVLSPLIGVGTSTGAPSVDIYSNSWTSGTDVGSTARTSLGVTSFYLPSERNASVITIPPDTTSRAVYVYLGATGLTFSTTGLAAFYTRGKASPVAITLVTQTVTGSYASGGFVEVSSTNQPGVYRLDLPNAALVDGVDDVTVTVRGAAGTNGAVLTISLLNEASIGASIVRMGPYQIKADGLGSSQPLDINVGAAQGIDTQVVDANGSGVDITASTLSVKVYDSGGILVATYVGTATYAADGRLTFAITTAVTGTAGTYTATITRTTSASDTQVFGPLRLYVRSV